MAKAREFGFEGQPFTLCSGPFAYGELLLADPEAVGVEDFDARFGEHKVFVKEREKWWPDEAQLYLYAYKEWRKFEKPMPIKVPPMVQTLMGPVEFIKEADMGQGVTINISNANPPTVTEDYKLLKAMAGDGKAIAELEGEKDEEALEEGFKPYPNEHAARVKDPGAFQEGSFRSKALKGGVRIIIGRLKGETTTTTQSYRFAADKYTAAEAKAWLKEHDVKYSAFEAATGEEKVVQDLREGTKELTLDEMSRLVWQALEPPQAAAPIVQSVASDQEWPRDVMVYDDHVDYRLGEQFLRRKYKITKKGELELGDPVELMLSEKTLDGGTEPLPVDKAEGAREEAKAATEKPSTLESLRAQADKALAAMAGLWKAVTGDGAEEMALEGETGFKTFKAKDGKAYVLTWTTNAFLDRDGEIFSTKAIEEYAERAWKEIKETGSKGQLDFWHAPGGEFADIMWAGAVGRFLVEVGTFHDDVVGQTFQKFFTECQEAQKDIAPEGWKTSHRYKFRPTDRADGVYEWFDKDRTSVLAAGRAANPYTSMEVITMLNDEQKEQLKKVGDATGISNLVELIEKRGESETKRLEEANVAHKDVGAPVAAPVAAAPIAAVAAAVAPAVEPAKVPEGDEVEAIAKRVAALMGLEELGKMLLGFQGSLEKVTSRLDEVEKGDLQKIEEKEAWRPNVPWFRASKADSTILDDTKDKELMGKKPEVPQAIQAMTQTIMGQPVARGGNS